MNFVYRIVIALFVLLTPFASVAGGKIDERPALARHFEAAGVRGTIVVRDIAEGRMIVFDRARAQTTYLPASTFKIPAALIALETGVVKDAKTAVFPWNGVKWFVAACNSDQTLATALARSCLPVFAKLGKRIGEGRLNVHLAAFDYGNHDATGGYPYWIKGNLRISAFQQVAFLDRLRRGELPVSTEHMQTLRDILILEKGDGYVIRAKTGWVTAPDPDIGWIVGWVERGPKTYIFALNIDVTRREHIPARLKIAKAILKDLGALP